MTMTTGPVVFRTAQALQDVVDHIGHEVRIPVPSGQETVDARCRHCRAIIRARQEGETIGALLPPGFLTRCVTPKPATATTADSPAIPHAQLELPGVADERQEDTP